MLKKISVTLLLFICNFFTQANVKLDALSLFNDKQYQEVRLSPDAKYISMIVMHENKRALAVLDRKTRQGVGFISLPLQSEVGHYVWANNERVVINVIQKKSTLEEEESFGELFAADYDGGNRNLIYGYRSGESQVGSRLNRKKQDYGWAEIIDTLPYDERHILITSTPMNKSGDRLGTIQKLDIYKGYQKKQGRSPAPNAQIIADDNGELKLAIGIDRNFKKVVYFRKGDQWQKVNGDKFGANFTPLTVTESGSGFYALDNYQQNFIGLFEYKFSDDSYKKIFIDKKVDVSSANISSDGKHVYALRIDDGYPGYLLINKKLPQTQVFRKMLASFPGHAIELSSSSKDGRFHIVRVSSDINPGQYYFFDAKKDKLSNLFASTKIIAQKEMSYTEPFSFQADDGLTLNGYITKAKSLEDKPAPLIMLVHGGPEARDNWEYDPEVQYLALNGYNVLQLNFRGSSGYGSKYLNAGRLHWGDRIQKDLKQAVDWAVTNKITTADKVCIMGASFGGYSAIQSAIKYPDLYQCAVANAGIYDLALFYSIGDITKKNFGDSLSKLRVGTDKAVLKAMSPVYHINTLKIPVFIAHGERDERAPIEHFERLKEQLDKQNKEYEMFVLSNESHGFWNADNQKNYMSKVKQFLDKNLL